MKIEKVNQKSTVTVFGVPFHGIDEIKKYANSGESKDGVYVGEDYHRYPCFDSEDYASENRYYSNFVFAMSQDELKVKLDILKDVKCLCNYRKLKEDSPVELCPMIYFGGDTYHPMEISVCNEILIGSDSTENQSGESFLGI